ncbi:hypothetical protein BDA96_10G232700 [Sorghum bicolor]|uniref:Receptor kinase-like protein Xa21 n=3 Tax=Sorghum bicolor TaxID=4558 RepID=A0A921Q4Q7_SORBI|nr:receptor kinase-like protein Xa21 [Sorghum bicolor]KAG0514898.1 hypothetical protein BDA96_10G232700 [Sorghum bicolor]KXG20259.1 hypothetical protein SORBI_3010G176700 [Sorghum bicolor]|eukprot:XP_021304661.1 receptor kinase-like protein Xa21 [Sorghum bicolor]
MASLGILSPNVAWLLCLLIFCCSLPLDICDESEDDRQALLCFKSQLSGPPGLLASWSNESMELCNWHGVTCSAQRPPLRVVALDLASEGITGSLSPCIGNLSSLAKLQLSNNSFHGGIPSELGLLSRLSNLNLSMNSLEGTIPSELSLCTQLQFLGLWNNSLHGEIPPSLSQCMHLQEINLSNNQLQGSIPSAFGTLPELRMLNLASNMLSGNIPPSLGTTLSLRYVDLGRNALTGEIPELLASSSTIQVLRLMSNNLSGELPKALFNTSSLIAICLQKNSFSGSIPPITANSPPVEHLHLGENYLSGTIHPSLGNLSSLLTLRIQYNNLVGSIPESLGYISTLEILNLNVNNLWGPFPQSLFNMSSLIDLAVANNSLVGRLPSNIGYTLPNIQGLILSANKFAGPIPSSLLVAYQLQWLQLADNRLTGLMPYFGSLPNLEVLDVSYNMLEAGDWGFVSSLSNCSKLTQLMLDGNNLQGNLPSSIGNLSSNLQLLWLRNNRISGHIPPEIGNLRSLSILFMDYNMFTGNIPPTIGNLHDLVVLAFAQNRLSGPIPEIIGNLVQLTDIKLDRNNLSGTIPASIGSCTQLQILNLAHNSLNGTIPSDIFKISSLSEEFDLSHNSLTGGIPEEVGNLINLKKLSITNNMLSGYIPSAIGMCVALEYLEMRDNFFEGSIPQTLVNLRSIEEIDISKNRLSGNIPDFFQNLSSLHQLNLSFNSFSGAVPSGGIFGNASAVSIEGNDELCTRVLTGGVSLCPAMDKRTRKHKSLLQVIEIVIPIVAVVIITCFCLVTFFWSKKIKVKKYLQHHKEHKENITYKDIEKATDMFSSANLIGSGSFGMVYKGKLKLQKDQVAIKILNLGTYGAHRSFLAECEALRNVRHRNLIKIITLCSSVDPTGADFKAIVFPYMPNGNLDMWLHPRVHEHSERKILTFFQRINIALDVACALDYLHNQCVDPLIHCDLKPSNILLDLDMAAYVSDFGLARILYATSDAFQDSSTSLACLKGSIGYIPPEYGMSKEISTKGDVYSFGVLLLEMITGYRPTDEKLKDGISLQDFVGQSFPNNIDEIVSPVMVQDSINAAKVMQNCILPLVKIGLSCSMASPKERPGMDEVCNKILTIKHIFSKMYSST